jgi:hypothetical protein
LAKSQLKNTRGLNIRPKKKRDKSARASVQFNENKDGTTTVVKKDDGDPTITYRSRDRRKKLTSTKTVRGSKTVTSTRETAASKKKYKDWYDNRNNGGRSRKRLGDSLKDRGHDPRYVYNNTGNKTETKTTTRTVPTSKTVTTSKPNPNYNKKKKPQKAYSDKAKNPGGGPGSRFIGKREKMSAKEAGKYNRYLRR